MTVQDDSNTFHAIIDNHKSKLAIEAKARIPEARKESFLKFKRLNSTVAFFMCIENRTTATFKVKFNRRLAKYQKKLNRFGCHCDIEDKKDKLNFLQWVIIEDINSKKSDTLDAQTFVSMMYEIQKEMGDPKHKLHWQYQDWFAGPFGVRTFIKDKNFIVH